MKKIILFLSVAIICVGVAFGLNADSNTGEKNEASVEQSNLANLSTTKSSNKVDYNKKKNSDNKELEKENNTNSNKENDKKELESTDSKKNANINLDKKEDKHQSIDSENSLIDEKPSTNQKPSNDKKPSEDKKIENISNTDKKETVTISINAKTAIDYGINNKDGFTHLPSNGVILSPQKVDFKEGDTVFDIFSKTVKSKGIQMEYTGTGSAVYIEGIDNLYEFDCGKYSGWMYEVNGEYPNYGVGAYKLKSGDNIVFNYTCDLGRDLGAPLN